MEFCPRLLAKNGPPGADVILNGLCSFPERLFSLSLRFRDEKTLAVIVPSVKPKKKKSDIPLREVGHTS
jgi:hypothetical protein